MEIELSEEANKKVRTSELKTKEEIAAKIYSKNKKKYGVSITYLNSLITQERLTLFVKTFSHKKKLYYVSEEDQKKHDWGINDKILSISKNTPNKVYKSTKNNSDESSPEKGDTDFWSLFESGVPLHKAFDLSKKSK